MNPPSALKSILVHLDASPRSAERLGLAQRLARLHEAELTAVYGVVPALLATPWFTGETAAAAVEMLAEVDREQRAQARAVYERADSQSALGWEALDDPALLPALTRRALLADLMVLGQPDPHDGRTGALPPDLLASLVIDSGRPTLMVPRSGSFEAQADRVLIAWKPSREAARALHAALPWLRRAEAIELVHLPELAEPDYDALRHALRLHGVGAPIECRSLNGHSAGEALLDHADAYGADLLVMGCYGHSRAREWVLGGVSNQVIQQAKLPVLFVH